MVFLDLRLKTGSGVKFAVSNDELMAALSLQTLRTKQR